MERHPLVNTADDDVTEEGTGRAPGTGSSSGSRPILGVIRSVLPALPPQQQQLAQLALDSPGEVGRMTITDFAEAAGTSAASVTRLCRSLDVERFADLRTELVLAATRSETATPSGASGDITAETPLPDLVENLAVLDVRSIEETSRMLDTSVFEAVVTALSKAGHVYTIGSGSNHAVATSIEHKMRSLAIPATTFHDPPSAVIGLTAARPGDVLVVVSETGTESETVGPLTEAARHRCTTVLITRLSRSPAAELADHVLLAVQDSSPMKTGTLTSRVAELFLADCLAGGLVVRQHQRSTQALASVEEALERYW